VATAYLVVLLYVFVVVPTGSAILSDQSPGGEMADTAGLNPADSQGSYGFDPRLGHHSP
jgi:hypothetical protein